MLKTPHPSSSCAARRGRTAFALVSLLLFVLASGAQAQEVLSIPGAEGPAAPSVKQSASVQTLAARGEAPLSRLYAQIKLDPARAFRLPTLDEREMQGNDTGKQVRVGAVRALPLTLDAFADGALYNLDEGEVRVMGVVSEGALFTRLHFTGVALPAGARIFVSSMKNPDEFYGPYEGAGPSKDGTFWTPPIEGEGVIVEYFVPKAAVNSARGIPFQISEVSHIFRDPLAKDGPNSPAGPCNLDVTTDWTDTARSVGHLQFTKTDGDYICTGTLLNDQANDFIPYLLTANHCFSTQTEAQTLRVYWLYNTGDFPSSSTPRTDGANLLATGTGSDFTFVRLTGALPNGLYFSGWDAAATTVPSDIVGIHHPHGSHKRISFGHTSNVNCPSGLPGPCANFTKVGWDEGTTEGGSSGSGIWKGTGTNARLVGNLYGGASACDNLSGIDYYGSFSVTYPSVSSYLTGTGGGGNADDNFEDNDTRSAARTVDNGTYGALVVSSSDEDWYRVTAAPGSTVSFSLNFTHSDGDVDVALYRGSDTSPIATSESVNNVETVQDLNTTGAPASYYLRVYLFSGSRNTYSMRVQGASGANCTLTPITVGQSLTGSLAGTDCQSVRRPGRSADQYYFNGTAGQQIAVSMSSASFDTYLYLLYPNGDIANFDDDGGGGTNSRIPIGGFYTLSQTGTYIIEATSYSTGATGSYNLSLTQQSVAPSFQLSQSSYIINEGSGYAAITVTRLGDTSTAATVKYTTSDATDVNFRCNPTTAGQITGAASRKCDYHISSGRLRFDPGETSKAIIISLVDDVYVEGNENFTITLSNPTVVPLGQPSTATLTITDNDTPGQPNPIDGTRFYVRQLYVDLLSREPDPAGWDGWTNRINLCGQPGQAPPPCDRVTVGGDGFLRSVEFFDRQFFVLRLYRTGFGRILLYDEVGDLAYVSGFLTDQQLELNKQELVAEIMSRPEFANRYNGLVNSSFVDTLLQTAGVTVAQTTRDGWVAALNANTRTRAQVYREISERPEVSNRYLHEAQVVSCYYGFFTRNPDGAYFNFLDRLDRGEINLGDLANAFINAVEYRQRFGP